MDLSGTQLKRWVINISKRQLSKTETISLAKGLNYAVSPKEVPVDDFIVATEQACWKIPEEEKDTLRSEVVGLLKNHRTKTGNMSQEERKAIKELKRDKSIMIMGADKGRATVIMDKCEYEEKVNLMLQDTKTYEKLDKNPTSKFKGKLVDILKRLKADKKITDKQYWDLYPTMEKTPRLYCSPKIHKAGNPLRPIVDYTGSICYKIARALADLLQPLFGLTIHHCKNSKDFVDSMNGIQLEDDEVLVSFDVVSLFTNTPIQETLDIVKERLQNDKTLKERTLLDVDDIIELLKFVLNTTYFSFRGQIYQQKFGAAMGSPVSPIIANIFMEDLEQKAIATAPPNCKPKFWKRYVDDVASAVKRGQAENLRDHLNTVDQTRSMSG